MKHKISRTTWWSSLLAIILIISQLFLAVACDHGPREQAVEQASTEANEPELGSLPEIGGKEDLGGVETALEPKPAATWNSWFETTEGEVSKFAPELIVDKDVSYEFVLDLSSIDYASMLSAPIERAVADVGLRRKIDRLLSTGKKSLKLKIRPVMLGDEIEIIDAKPFYDLHLNLTRLQSSKEWRDEIDLSKQQYLFAEITFQDFVNKIHAGEVRFEVAAKKPGCATIALSVWDRRGAVPYDHLVRTVAVKRPGEPAPDCGNNRLRGGFATLLDTAIERTQGEPVPTDVSLHIFEFAERNDTKSVAVMVDRVLVTEAGASTESIREGVYAWEMKSRLTDYISNPIQLHTKLEEARDIASLDSPNPSYPYSKLAEELAEKIFTPGEQSAASALTILKQRVKDQDRRLTMLVRLISSNNEPFYLPLALLSASGEKPVLSKPITVIQPLPRERYLHRYTCIDPWTFALPKEMEGVQKSSLANIERPELTWAEWLSSIADLKTYLKREESVFPNQRGEGLVLLSHHDSGVLWFDKPAERTQIEDVLRDFRPGSAALLAACTGVGVEGENQLIMDEFNERGMDALIVSPFQVRADYGARLATKFVLVVQEERNKRATATITELFDKAAKKTSDSFPGKQLQDMALEFMVLGDHSLRLCEP
jgi:hypothetical protein